MKRAEFSVATKKAAYERSGGLCECGCAMPFDVKNPPEYDHRVEAALGGDNSLDNCVVLRLGCHRSKTSRRAPALAKAARLEKKAANIRSRRQKFPGAKDGPWKAKIGGRWVRRDSE